MSRSYKDDSERGRLVHMAQFLDADAREGLAEMRTGQYLSSKESS